MPAIAVFLGLILALITLPGCAVFSRILPAGDFVVESVKPERRPDGSERLVHYETRLNSRWLDTEDGFAMVERFGYDPENDQNYILERQYSIDRGISSRPGVDAFGRQAEVTAQTTDLFSAMASAMFQEAIRFRIVQEEERTARRDIEARRDVSLEELARMYPEAFEEHHQTPAPPEEE